MSLTPIRYPVANPKLEENERHYLNQAIETSWISSTGPYINQFEATFSAHFGPGHCVAVSNGTIAIELALLAVGISPGDEVIVPNFTFVGSVSPIYRLHAIPVLAPTEKNGWNLDADALERLITKKTRAIIAVHLYGVPCDIKKVLEIANKHHLKVIEDCAESLGAKVDERQVGTFGDVGCFSFFGNKVLTTGEGGMCITQDEAIAEKIRLYRDHGMSKELRYWHKVIGYNGRMTNLQAAVGIGQCERSKEMIERRNQISAIYDRVFLNTPFFRTLPKRMGVEDVCWLKSPLLKNNCNLNRDALLKSLLADGIDCRPFFYTCASMPAYSRFGLDDENSIDIAGHGFNLPTYTQLKDDEVVEIAEKVASILSEQYQPDSQKTIYPTLPISETKGNIHVSIILPTYNEQDNAVKIIDTLRHQMVSISKSYEILIMDDCSSDNTVVQIEAAFSRDPNVIIHVRRNLVRGLAASIHDGIKLSRGEYILVMDSDFNHDPLVTSQMVKFAEFYDIVSGSRFTTGGGMQNRLRWWCSLIFNLFIRVLLSLPTQDNLAGFYCIRKKTLLNCQLETIFKNSGDYFFRLLYELNKSHKNILEIPVIYKDEEYGVSKTPFIKTLCLYIKESLKLRFGS